MASENESEKRETLAEVLAEMRAEAARADMEQFYTLDDAAESMREYADRIEAAWKREKAEAEADALAVGGIVEAERHKPDGNAAAEREALNKVGNAAAWIAESCNDQQTAEYMNDIIAIVQSALSAPARNCDRPECATSKAAQNVWRKEDGGKTPYYEWLLAPAAEREGGGDGRR